MAFLDNTGLAYFWGKLKTYVASAISGKEDASNKVTSLTYSSTDTQYPSAKAVYDNLILKEDVANKVDSIWPGTGTEYSSVNAVTNFVLTDILGENILDDSDMASSPYVFSVGRFFIWADGTNEVYRVCKVTAHVDIGDQLEAGVNFTSYGGLLYFLKQFYDELVLKEDAANRVTSLDSSSSDMEYPSAKAVYDAIAAVDEKLLGMISDTIWTLTDMQSTPRALSEDEFIVAEIESGSWALIQCLDDISAGHNMISQPMWVEVNIGGELQYIHNQLALKEVLSNKVTSISSSSTNTQYPSAKLVYDKVLKLNTVTLVSSGWSLDSNTGYYTQSKTVSGMTTSSYPTASITYPAGTTSTTKKAIDKAAGLLVEMTTSTDAVTFSAVSEPSTDITLTLKGV